MKKEILFLDIETQPNLAYVWGKYQQDVLEFKQEWIIIGFSVKWLNGSIHTYALPDFPGYKPGTEDDRKLVEKIWDYLDEAEIVCGHNGRDFDIKKINARFAFHGITPPTPYKIIDTLQAARKYFGFTSNKLDDLGRYLKIGRKVPNGGFKLWLDCIAGDRKAWKLMKKYNEYDVILLEKLYKKLLPFIGNHPPMGMYNGKPFSCPNCGSDHLQSRGTQISKTGKTQRYQCQSCASWCKTAVSIPGTKKPLIPI